MFPLLVTKELSNFRDLIIVSFHPATLSSSNISYPNSKHPTLNPLQLYSLIFSLPWNESKLINYIAKKERKLNSSLQFIKTHKQNKRVSINLVESPFSASRSRFRYRTRNTAITSRKRKVGGGKGTKGTVEGEKEIQLILRLRQRRARRKSARYRASSSDKANRVSCYEISLALNPFSFLGIESTCRGQVHGGIRHTNTNGLGTRILSGE